MFSLAVLVLILSGEVFSIKEYPNPYVESSYFHGLAERVNSEPNLLWRAGFGHLRSFNYEYRPTLQHKNTSRKVESKRQVYSSPSIDWRSAGKLADPEHQGACGSCWAFASVHTLMDNIRIRTSSPVYLSTQHVLECCVSRACGGCSGASDNAAGFDFLSRKYTVESICKRYAYHDNSRDNPAYGQPGQSCSDYCDYPNTVSVASFYKYNITDFVRLDSDVNQIKAALSSGPLVAAVQLFGDLYLYESGVYRHIAGPPLGYHSVEMVGYGSEAGQDYWIIKNSWGYTWGEQGYFRIAAGSNEAKVEDHVIQPILSGDQLQRSRGLDEAFSTPVGGSSEIDVNSPHVRDVANFVAHEIKPICSDGKLDEGNLESVEIGEAYQVKRILRAYSKIVGGILYNVNLELGLPRCSKLMYVESEVYLPSVNGRYILQKYDYTTNALINTSGTVKALWPLQLFTYLIGVLCNVF